MEPNPHGYHIGHGNSCLVLDQSHLGFSQTEEVRVVKRQETNAAFALGNSLGDVVQALARYMRLILEDVYGEIMAERVFRADVSYSDHPSYPLCIRAQ